VAIDQIQHWILFSRPDCCLGYFLFCALKQIDFCYCIFLLIVFLWQGSRSIFPLLVCQVLLLWCSLDQSQQPRFNLLCCCWFQLCWFILAGALRPLVQTSSSREPGCCFHERKYNLCGTSRFCWLIAGSRFYLPEFHCSASCS
jgi:hypothetical protein